MTDEPRVAIVVSKSGAEFIRTLVRTAMEASGEALELVPSVDVQVRIVEKRALLLDALDAIDLALLPHETEGTQR